MDEELIAILDKLDFDETKNAIVHYAQEHKNSIVKTKLTKWMMTRFGKEHVGKIIDDITFFNQQNYVFTNKTINHDDASIEDYVELVNYDYKKTVDLLLTRQKNTKDYIMLGEYIDNSISSYIGNRILNPEKKVAGLLIQIEIIGDNSERSLRIIDNAYGLTGSEMLLAIKHGAADKAKLINNTALNHYGVGMKNASFWAGDCFEIYSKSNKSNVGAYWKFDIDEANRNDDGRVKYKVRSTNQELTMQKKNGEFYQLEHGTELVISKIHGSKKYNWTFNKFAEVMEALGWKYGRYINQGLTISLKSNATQGWVDVVSFQWKCENIQKWWLNNKKDYTTIGQDELVKENKLKNIFYSAAEINDDFISKSFAQSVSLGESLRWPLTFNYKNLQVDGWIGINNSSATFSKECGFTIYEMNRAIFYGPNNFTDNLFVNNYLSPLANYGSDDYKIDSRIIGAFDFDNFINGNIVYLEDNKKGFDWLDEVAEERFNSFLKEKIIAIREVMHKFIEFTMIEKKLKIATADAERVFSESFPKEHSVTYIERNNSDYAVFDKVNDQSELCLYHVKIQKNLELTIGLLNITEPNEFNNFFKYEVDKQNFPELDYIVYLNVQHPIWFRLFELDVKSKIKPELVVALHKWAIAQLIEEIVKVDSRFKDNALKNKKGLDDIVEFLYK